MEERIYVRFYQGITGGNFEGRRYCGGRVSYRMLKSESFCDGNPRDVYGIEVVSSLFDGRESALLMDISTDYDCVKNLYDMVVENLVMPCTLKDITEDYLETVSSY